MLLARLVARVCTAPAARNLASGMVNTYYAVAKGKKPGVYTSWDQAKRQVLGFTGAVHKSFKTQQAAMEYLQQQGVAAPAAMELPSPAEAASTSGRPGAGAAAPWQPQISQHHVQQQLQPARPAPSPLGRRMRMVRR